MRFRPPPRVRPLPAVVLAAALALPAAALALPGAALALPAAPSHAAQARAKLPLVVIQTNRAIPNEPKVPARVRVVARAGGYAGRAGIETRGHSSQTFPKSSTASSCATAVARGATPPCSACRPTTTGCCRPTTPTRR